LQITSHIKLPKLVLYLEHFNPLLGTDHGHYT